MAVGLLTILSLEVVNTTFFQPLMKLNSNMFMVEAFTMNIVWFLYALYHILLNEKINNVLTYHSFLVLGIFIVL